MGTLFKAVSGTIGWMIAMGLIAVPPAFAQESLPFMPEAPPSKKIPRTPEAIEAGKKIYVKRCLPCHGEKGASDGAAAIFLDPRPRDFTRGLFKLKTTASEDPPTDEDHFRTVTRGIPGSAMPSFKSLLSETERWQVVFYEQTFSDRFDPNNPPKSIVAPPHELKAPSASPESVTKGKEIFMGKAACFTCHGQEGRGDGLLAMALKDKWDNPILPRNLTKSWRYKGGNKVTDVFTRVSTGIAGTPMPEFASKLSEEERWQVAHYVKSLQKEVKGAQEVVLKPKAVEGELPLDPNDPVWEGLPQMDIPLSGQIIIPPRNQNPSVDLITVKAIYNQDEIAFHLQWDDRFKNVTHDDSKEVKPPELKEGDPLPPTYPILYPPEIRNNGPFRDAVAVQLPVKIPSGPEKPHFYQGGTGKPVNLWIWKSDWNEDGARSTPVQSLVAKGFKAPTKELAQQTVMGKGIFSQGQWKVVMKRSLASEDPSNSITLERGRMIPIAFHVWDGANGEHGHQRSISSWFFLLLEQEAAASVYGYTLVAVVLAAGLEVYAIRRVRNGSRTKGRR